MGGHSLSLLISLMLVSCASHTPVSPPLTLSDFGHDEQAFAAYQQAYRKGYESGLQGWTSDLDYAPHPSPAERAAALGFHDGQRDGSKRFMDQWMSRVTQKKEAS